MIAPKTDWKSTDYYNVEDHNRIVSNLNELLNRYNLTPLLSTGAVGELLTEEHLLGIVRSCNAVLEAAGYKTTIESRKTWFDADDLNKIESTILALNDINQSEGKAEYSAGLVYDTGAVYGGGAHG